MKMYNPILYNLAKEILRRKFIALKPYSRNKERLKINEQEFYPSREVIKGLKNKYKKSRR